MPDRIKNSGDRAGVEIPISPASLLRLKAGEPAEAKPAGVDSREALDVEDTSFLAEVGEML